MFDCNLKNTIRKARELKGITQEELADKLDIARSNYAYQESRGEKLTIEKLQKIAVALGVSIFDLLGKSSDTNTEIQKLKAEIQELKIALERAQSTVDVYNRMFKTIDGNWSKPDK